MSDVMLTVCSLISHVHGTWYIGTVIGHQMAWVRNCSPGARGARWPGALSGGWEYRAGYSGEQWSSDDTSLSVQGLPGNAKIISLYIRSGKYHSISDVERIRDLLCKKRPAKITKS